MKKISFIKKLKERSGETLVETLVAILVIALASLLLAAMVSSSGSIDMSAREKDAEFYKGLSDVELKEDAETVADGKVIFRYDGDETETAPVDAYKGDGLYSYSQKGG